MKQHTIQNDPEFRAAQDLLDELTAKKELVDKELADAWREREQWPSNAVGQVGVIEHALQMKPGVEAQSSVEREEWMRRPSILQDQSYKLQLAVGAQASKVEIARTRASLRLLGTIGEDYRKRAGDVLAAVDALIAANNAARNEHRKLTGQGLSGIPEVQFPDSGMTDALSTWRESFAETVAGLNRLAGK